MLTGYAHKLEPADDINTDYIISGRYKFKIQDPGQLAKHIFEDLVPDFYSRIKKGDFIVAGRNFGCGSSREQAPLALKYAGLAGVIAKSFARIFYRNSFNLGLPLIDADTDGIDEGDRLEIDLQRGQVKNITKKTLIVTRPIPGFMEKILNEGGVVEYFTKYGSLPVFNS